MEVFTPLRRVNIFLRSRRDCARWAFQCHIRPQSYEASSSHHVCSDFPATQSIPEYYISFLGVCLWDLLTAVGMETSERSHINFPLWDHLISVQRKQCLPPLLSFLYFLCCSWLWRPCSWKASQTIVFLVQAFSAWSVCSPLPPAAFAELFSLPGTGRIPLSTVSMPYMLPTR